MIVYPDLARAATRARVRTFWLIRGVDVTGVSGTGVVAVGVEFADGQCVLKWLTAPGALGVYDSIGAVEVVHGHDGLTRLEFDDSPVTLSR